MVDCPEPYLGSGCCRSTDGTQISMVGGAHIITLTDSDSTHNIPTNPTDSVNDSDTDTDSQTQSS